jgi:hypothetical protein
LLTICQGQTISNRTNKILICYKGQKMQHKNVTFLSLSLSNSFFEKQTFSISPLLFL